MNRLTYFFISLTLILLHVTTFAQQNETEKSVNTEFNLALNLYDSDQYNDAVSIFNKIINDYELNSKTTASILFKGKSLLRLKKYGEAEAALKQLIGNYPASKYLDEARMTLAKCYYENKNYAGALNSLIEILRTTTSAYYNSYAKSTGEKIAVDFLSIPQLKTLYNSASGNNIKAYLLFVIGKYYMSRNNNIQAARSFSDLIKQYPDSEEKSEATTLYQEVLNSKSSAAQSGDLLGVMLPVGNGSGDSNSGPAAEILEGIKFAVSEYNETHEARIGLLIRNTERKDSKIEEIKNEFVSLPNLKSIIGPIYTDEVVKALNEFKNSGIPIISPTATGNDLTQINNDFFQANPSFAVRGMAMAQYIYFVENKRKIAVLNAVEGYSPLLADSFIAEFEKLGGQIIIRETYKSNSFDLNEPVSRIARFADSLEGIYVPLVNKIDAPLIMSQMVQAGLELQIYGNQDWFLAKGYETSPTLSSQLTFSSDYFIDYNNADFQLFSKKFAEKTGSDPNRNNLYGYDITRYILNMLYEANEKNVKLVDLLESGIKGEGFHDNFYFDAMRINKFINILRYKDGVFELIDKFKATNTK